MATYVSGFLQDTAVQREIDRIAEVLVQPTVQLLQLSELYSVPKPDTGMTVLVDATTGGAAPFGSGAGVYTYYGGAWNYLG